MDAGWAPRFTASSGSPIRRDGRQDSMLPRYRSANTVSKKSALANAIGYALTRWTALTRYRDDGRIEIDNNNATAR